VFDAAPCSDHPNPDLWFPEKGHSSREAKQLCRVCPVQAACLEVALSSGYDLHGVWGATTEKDRRDLRRVKAPA